MTVRVPMLDLRAQHATVHEAVHAAIGRVMESQQFVLGPEVEAFEARIASFCGVTHAIGVSSGTDALLVALMALGIGPGDEVITTPFTFVATCASIARLGARAVLVDIEPRSFNVDATAVEAAITERTRAIVPVHLFGQMSDVHVLSAIAARHGLAVVEDAAQAIGAELAGRRAGACGTAGTFSFFPSKNLGAAGDAGMVVTDDGVLAARMRRLRNHGQEPKYASVELGGNFRLDALQAAVLGAKLPWLEEWTAARRRNAARYRALFEQAGLLREQAGLALPAELPERFHVYNQFVVRARHRDRLREHLARAGIATEVYYPRPMHLQPCFAGWGYREGMFPEAERAARECLAIPVYPELTEAMQHVVVDAIAAFCRAC